MVGAKIPFCFKQATRARQLCLALTILPLTTVASPAFAFEPSWRDLPVEQGDRRFRDANPGRGRRPVHRRTATPTATPTPSATPERDAVTLLSATQQPAPQRTASPSTPEERTAEQGADWVPRRLSCPANQSKSSASHVYEYDDGNTLAAGKGFDPEDLTKSYRRCMKGNKFFQSESNYSRTFFDIKEIRNRSELHKSVGQSLKAHVRGTNFKVSADYSSTRNESLQGDSMVFAVSGRVDFGKFELQDRGLRDEYLDLVADENLHPAFFQQCGEMVVVGARKEVRFSVLYEYTNLSKEERRNLRRAFNASYNGGEVRVGGGATFTNAVKKLGRRSEAKIQVALHGGDTAGVDFLHCLLGGDKNLSDPADVKTCIQDALIEVSGTERLYKVTESTSIPVEYYATDWGTEVGVQKCWQPNIEDRDRILGELYEEYEETSVLRARLSSLYDEIARNLLPADAELPMDLPAQVAQTIDAADTHLRNLGKYLQQCACGGALVSGACPSTGERNYAAYCKSPTQLRCPLPPTPRPAGCLDAPPSVPVDVAEYLYNRDRWSMFRWCDGYAGTGPDVSDEGVGETLSALAPGATKETLDCYDLDFNAKNRRTAVLQGFAKYNLRPLNTMRNLEVLTVEGRGSFYCRGVAETAKPATTPGIDDEVTYYPTCDQHTPDADDPLTQATTVVQCGCQKSTKRLLSDPDGALPALHQLGKLKELNLRGVAIDHGILNALFNVGPLRCKGGTKKGSSCSNDADCPGSMCLRATPSEIWPNLMTLDLSGNALDSLDYLWPTSLETLNLEDNALGAAGEPGDVARIFGPMTKLKVLDVREPLDRRSTRGVVKNHYYRDGINEHCLVGAEAGEWSRASGDAKNFLVGLRAALAQNVAPGSFKLQYTYRGIDLADSGGKRVCQRCMGEMPPINIPNIGERNGGKSPRNPAYANDDAMLAAFLCDASFLPQVRMRLDYTNRTITDAQTGLTWEMLDDGGTPPGNIPAQCASNNPDGLHDVDCTYTWTDAVGSRMTRLNTPPCFAGHCDWRLPLLKELLTLFDPTMPSSPFILGEFANSVRPPGACLLGNKCSFTNDGWYWSSTESIPGRTDLHRVFRFDQSKGSDDFTTGKYFVRAVRGAPLQ